MSKTQSPDSLLVDSEAELREMIGETFESHRKSRQADGSQRAHIDGDNMRRRFGMRRLSDVLAEKHEDRHPMATQPRAFIDALVHLDEFDQRLLQADVDLTEYSDRYPEPRREVLEWVAEHCELGRLNKGGTDTFLHGLPGSTKTTCMQYLAARVQEVNYEDAVWAAMPGRSQWVTLAPWATVFRPSDLDMRVRCVPVNPKIDPFEVEMDEIVRDVVEYDDPEDLMERMRKRPKGEFYVTYPDPKFRLCRYLTGFSYTPVWEADDLEEATDLEHWWFAWAEARVRGEQTYWTSLFLDEADELLDEDAAKDQHDYYQKVKNFRNSFRDFRKTKCSLYLAAHNRGEVNLKVRKKLRWTLTMNQEEMPGDAPVDGNYTEYMDPGEGMIWKRPKSASFSWPNMGSYISVPAKFIVEYPEYETERRAVARGGGEDSA